MLLSLLGACASREKPFVLHRSEAQESSRHWNPPHAYAFHVQMFTSCANKERAVTSFELPPEGEFSIFGYRIGEEQGPASLTVHHVSFLPRTQGSGNSSSSGASEVVGKMVVGAFFPVFVAAAIVVAPVAISAIVYKEIHKPRKEKDVANCYTWVEDASGAVVSGQPPFRGVGDS